MEEVGKLSNNTISDKEQRRVGREFFDETAILDEVIKKFRILVKGTPEINTLTEVGNPQGDQNNFIKPRTAQCSSRTKNLKFQDEQNQSTNEEESTNKDTAAQFMKRKYLAHVPSISKSTHFGRGRK